MERVTFQVRQSLLDGNTHFISSRSSDEDFKSSFVSLFIKSKSGRVESERSRIQASALEALKRKKNLPIITSLKQEIIFINYTNQP